MVRANFDRIETCEVIRLVLDFLKESGQVSLASAQKLKAMAVKGESRLTRSRVSIHA